MITSVITMALPPPGTKDRWSEFQKKVEKDPVQGSKRLDELEAKCICPDCPTHKECAKQRGELFYCSFNSSRSDCITEENWCICETCPVAEEMGLTKLYYCIKGNENEQRSSP